MSSYFDNQYGGEDDDNKFKGDSDDESSSDTETEEDEVEVEEQEEAEDDVEDDIEDEIDDDEENDDDVQEGGEPDSELEEGEMDEEAEKKAKKIKKVPAKNVYKKPIDFVDDDEDDDGEQYLQKFDQNINDNYIVNFHPESILQNYDEILSMTKVSRNADGIIIDPLHRTIPYLTKYEKARILGQRAKQINSGAYPFVKVPENVIDGYIIAEMELKQKRIPFIIRRPLPNGGSEYWKVQDLEDISF